MEDQYKKEDQYKNASQCQKCGVSLPIDSPQCSNCGEIQDTFHYTSRIAAAALALFGGMFGIHRFYLRQWWGLFYLLFFWTYIPWLIGIIEGIIFLSTTQKDWNEKYNQGISAGQEKGTVVVILAIFIPIIFVLGILAAIAIPAYQGYIVKAKMAETQMMADTVMSAVELYALSEEQWPQSINDLQLSGNVMTSQVSSVDVDDGVIYIHFTVDSGIHGSMTFIPEPTQLGIHWNCDQSSVLYDELPSKCHL